MSTASVTQPDAVLLRCLNRPRALPAVSGGARPGRCPSRLGDKSIEQARDLLDGAPDLADQVSAGVKRLGDAHQEMKDRQEKAAQKKKQLERVTKYADAVRNEEMSLEEALGKVAEDEEKAKARRAADAQAMTAFWKGLADNLLWLEHFVCSPPDAELEWFGDPEGPGAYDHGVTKERIEEVRKHLGRAGDIIFRERPQAPEGGQPSAKPRRRK
jgi:hypothetical protein